MEYPGYGIYKGTCSERKILFDALTVYKYINAQLKVEEKDIIVFGRSIGSGPASYIAATQKPGILILLSAFTSIRSVAKHYIGRVGQYLIKQRFDNMSHITEVKCPTLFIHGKKDPLIPAKHSQRLFGKTVSYFCDIYKTFLLKDACSSVKKKLIIRQDMTHNELDFYDDLSVPISDFLKAIGWISFGDLQEGIAFPRSLFADPTVRVRSNSCHKTNCMYSLNPPTSKCK